MCMYPLSNHVGLEETEPTRVCVGIADSQEHTTAEVYAVFLPELSDAHWVLDDLASDLSSNTRWMTSGLLPP